MHRRIPSLDPRRGGALEVSYHHWGKGVRPPWVILGHFTQARTSNYPSRIPRYCRRYFPPPCGFRCQCESMHGMDGARQRQSNQKADPLMVLSEGTVTCHLRMSNYRYRVLPVVSPGTCTTTGCTGTATPQRPHPDAVAVVETSSGVKIDSKSRVMPVVPQKRHCTRRPHQHRYPSVDTGIRRLPVC